MTVTEALQIVKNPASPLIDCVKAAGAIAESESVRLEDLLECLPRKGLCAEIAAMKLYKLSHRSPPASPKEFSIDLKDWADYLKMEGKI